MSDASDADRRLVFHTVTAVQIGDETRYDGGRLTVGRSQARDLLADPAFADVDVAVASPGDAVRIVKPLDVVEPRSADGHAFAGHLGAPRPRKGGDTHVLRGAAVLAAGYLPRNQEGVVDLSGPGAARSPFGSTHNVVVTFSRADGADWGAVDRALRHGVLALAVHLADAAVEAAPDEVASYRPPDGRRNGLPRVGVLTNLQTQGAFKDVFVYGRSLAEGLPILLDPAELDDGAVVSGQFGHPGLRNATYLHCNHPVVAELRRRDGDDLLFGGIVLAPEPVDLGGKEHVSAHAASVCRAAGFDAVIVTKEGGGNADNDLSLKMDALHDMGIQPVGIYAEMSGPDGTGQPVVAPPERATALISTGNYDELVSVPAMDRALGGDRVDIADADATAAMDLPTAAFLCSLSSLGWGRLTARKAT